jgi:hypothetical protein
MLELIPEQTLKTTIYQGATIIALLLVKVRALPKNMSVSLNTKYDSFFYFVLALRIEN